MLKNTSIKNNLVIIQLLTAVITIALCTVIFIFIGNRIIIDYNTRDLKETAKITAHTVITGLDFGIAYQKEVEQDLTTYLSVKPDINQAVVYDIKQEVFALYTTKKPIPPTIAHPGDFQDTIKETISEDGDLIVYVKIIDPSENTQLGILCLKGNIKTEFQVLVQFLVAGLSIFIIGSLLALIFATIFQKTISAPILNLVSSMQQVSDQKKFSIRAEEVGNNEITRLSRGFNQMLKQIEKNNKELIEAQKSLEDKVKKRTTELELKTKALEVSNRELEQFAYVASHDLQEPLRMIGSFSKMIERKYSQSIDPEVKEYVFFIVDGVSRMQKLIQDLLAFSRIGSRKADFKPINLEHIVDRSITNLKYTIEENNAEVVYEHLPTLVVDEVKIGQLFQNLISNALKFTASGKHPNIRISAEEKDDVWQIAIRDNGIGISEANRKQIFMLFQRIHSASEYPGNGIGLTICKRIVEIHGGEIWFESTIDVGTTFYFTIRKNITSSH